ncbi:MAG: MarR family transcriptional regulator [Fimbriimonadaceae bacterium]|nr:MarR family transcriptional regulator [Fimbriimonadaceae bacterium]
MSKAAAELLEHYPKIYFACHAQHVHDEETGNLLTSKQASLLDHLDTAEPISLNGLAKHLGITAATACVAVGRLEKLGYLKRTRSETDRRVVQLLLTQEGLRITQATSVLDPKRVAAMLEQLTDEEREAGLKGLAILAKAASEFIQTHGSGWSYSDEPNH